MDRARGPRIWTWIAVGLILTLPGCGKGGDSGTMGPSNSPPTASFAFSPASPVLMGGTVVRFTGTGTDPNGDPLTFTWNFGDGSTATGQNVTHAFTSAGTLTVVLTVADSRGAQTTSQNQVLVKSVTGRWVDADPRFQLQLTQTGSTFTGTVTVSGFGPVSNITDGVVSDPRAVAFHRQSFVPGFATVDYRGNLDATLDKMDVVAIQTSLTTFNLTRQ